MLRKKLIATGIIIGLSVSCVGCNKPKPNIEDTQVQVATETDSTEVIATSTPEVTISPLIADDTLSKFESLTIASGYLGQNTIDNASEVVSFVKSFYTDWFAMYDGRTANGEYLRTVFKTEPDEWGGRYADNEAFFNQYAASTVMTEKSTYANDLYVPDPWGDAPCDIYSNIKEFKQVKVLSGIDGVYTVGVWFTVEGTNSVQLNTEIDYFGTIMVTIEDGSFKVMSYTPFYPSFESVTNPEKSADFLELFKTKLNSETTLIDTIKDTTITQNDMGAILATTVNLDENKKVLTTESKLDGEKTIAQSIQALESEVVTIKCNDTIGTGVIVSPGVVLTALNNVRGYREGIVQFANGKTAHFENVLTFNIQLNLAFIILDNSLGKGVPISDASQLVRGNTIYTMTTNAETHHDTILGSYQTASVDGEVSLVYSNLTIPTQGQGSPLFNAKGQLIGINMAIVDNYADTTYGVSVYHMQPIINQLKTIPFEELPKTLMLNAAW